MTYDKLYDNIKSQFKLITGTDNKKMYGSKYFIPIKTIFIKRLANAIYEYSLDDLNKIERVLINHIKDSCSNNFPKFTRTMEYFIYGQNGKDCQLAVEYENIDSIIDKSEEIKFKSNIK